MMPQETITFSGKAKTAEDEQFAREVATYEALWPTLRKTHAGRWVAIKAGQVIDSDVERSALVQRVRDRYPKEVIYFEQVLPDRPHRIVDIPGIDTG